MTKTKSTKRALLSSALALLLCISMLIGSTFAWFTDSVTSGSNVITSGKLDVDLVDATGASLEGEMIKWAAKDGCPQDEILWEPGCTYNSEAFWVENKGNLNLKFKVIINGIDGDAELLEVIDFTAAVQDYYVSFQHPTWGATYSMTTDIDLINGTVIEDAFGGTYTVDEYILKPGEKMGPIVLSGHMDEAAGNKYQDLTIEGISVSVVATQAVGEEDSFDGMYDAGANYPGEVDAAEELAAALANGGNIKLVDDIALTEVAEVPAGINAVLDLNGNTLTGDILAPNADLTITNGTINDTTAANSAIEINAGTLNLVNVNITSARHAVRIDGDVTATINGGTYVVTGEYAMTTNALNVSGNATVTVNGGTFKGPKGTPNGAAMGGAAVTVQAGSTVIINGGDFSGGVNDTLASKGTLIVKGGTFDQDPSAYAAGSQVIAENGTWTVKPYEVATTDELDTAIVNGAANISLGSGNYIIPDSAQGKTLTIIGNGDTVVATQDDGSYEGCDYSLQGATVTFENITINTDSSTYTGYARLNATYNNCTINGTYTLYGDSEFNGCTFNVSGDAYNIWTWGAPNATFNGCTFNSDGKALLLYGGANGTAADAVTTKLTLNDCVFNDNGGLTDLKAAVEIGNDYNAKYELIVNNTVVNGYEINDKGINTGSTLWGNKNSMGTDKLNVVVDGVDVY